MYEGEDGPCDSEALNRLLTLLALSAVIWFIPELTPADMVYKVWGIGIYVVKIIEDSTASFQKCFICLLYYYKYDNAEQRNKAVSLFKQTLR